MLLSVWCSRNELCRHDRAYLSTFFFPHVNIITFSVNISHSMPQWRKLIVTQPSDDETHIYPSVHANQHDTHANSSPERLWFLFLGHLKLPSVHVPGISIWTQQHRKNQTLCKGCIAQCNVCLTWNMRKPKSEEDYRAGYKLHHGKYYKQQEVYNYL